MALQPCGLRATKQPRGAVGSPSAVPQTSVSHYSVTSKHPTSLLCPRSLLALLQSPRACQRHTDAPLHYPHIAPASDWTRPSEPSPRTTTGGCWQHNTSTYSLLLHLARHGCSNIVSRIRLSTMQALYSLRETCRRPVDNLPSFQPRRSWSPCRNQKSD